MCAGLLFHILTAQNKSRSRKEISASLTEKQYKIVINIEGVKNKMSKKEISNLSNAMADAVEKAAEYTVMVDARRRLPATGIAISKDLVLTANHVVEYDEGINIILPDGSKLAATVAGRDPSSDLALLKLEDAKANPMIHNGEPRVGQLVMALGRPSTSGIQASLGIISAMGGKVRVHHGDVLEKHIRTDAIPYPGFSGGPLIDTEGQVLGINTSGLGFSSSIVIPIDVARKIAVSLEKHGSIKRGYLGVRSQVVELPKKAKLDQEQTFGLLVANIEDDSPALEAGLIAGDILIGFNGQLIQDHESLFAAMSGEVVGQPAPLEFLRGGKPKKENVTLTPRKDSPHRKRSGRRSSRFGNRRDRSRVRRMMARKMRRKMHGHMHGMDIDLHHDDHDMDPDQEE